jgi:hypothetical protein
MTTAVYRSASVFALALAALAACSRVPDSFPRNQALAHRANCRDRPWFIRATICETVNMVRLEIWSAVLPYEWCVVPAALTAPIRSTQYVDTDCGAALTNDQAPCRSRRGGGRLLDRQFANFVQRSLPKREIVF